MFIDTNKFTMKTTPSKVNPVGQMATGDMNSAAKVISEKFNKKLESVGEMTVAWFIKVK